MWTGLYAMKEMERSSHGGSRSQLLLSWCSSTIFLRGPRCSKSCVTYEHETGLRLTELGVWEIYYRTPTKWRERNVLSCVCLSVCPKGGPHVTITHDALDLTTQGSPSITALPLPDMRPHYTLEDFPEARMVGKRVVCILLGFLVI